MSDEYAYAHKISSYKLRIFLCLRNIQYVRKKKYMCTVGDDNYVNRNIIYVYYKNATKRTKKAISFKVETACANVHSRILHFTGFRYYFLSSYSYCYRNAAFRVL